MGNCCGGSNDISSPSKSEAIVDTATGQKMSNENEQKNSGGAAVSVSNHPKKVQQSSLDQQSQHQQPEQLQNMPANHQSTHWD
jgi:hypothetical protein